MIKGSSMFIAIQEINIFYKMFKYVTLPLSLVIDALFHACSLIPAIVVIKYELWAYGNIDLPPARTIIVNYSIYFGSILSYSHANAYFDNLKEHISIIGQKN